VGGILVMCPESEGRVQRGQSLALSSGSQSQDQRPCHGHALKHRTFPLYVRNQVLTVRVSDH